MTITRDVETRFPAGGSTVVDTTTGDRTFTHAASANANGVVVFVACDTTDADGVTGIDYGGVALVRAQYTYDTSELGRSSIWTSHEKLIPGGTQTVTLQGCTAAQKVAAVETVICDTANAIRVNAVAQQLTQTSTNPTVNITTTASCLLYGAVSGGANAPGSYVCPTGFSNVEVADFGTRSARFEGGTGMVAAGTTAVGFTYATSDDWAMVAAAIEAYASTSPQTWTGSIGTATPAGVSGSFSGSGTATWADGSIGTTTPVGVSGDFQASAATAFTVESLGTAASADDGFGYDVFSAGITTPTLNTTDGALLLVTWIGARWGGTLSTFSISDTLGGLTWTPIDTMINVGPNWAYTQVWWAIATGSSGTITVTGATGTGVHLIAVDQIIGADETTPCPQFDSYVGFTGDVTLTLPSTPDSTSMVWTSSATDLPATTIPTGYTGIDAIVTPEGDHHLNTAWHEEPVTVNTVAWSGGGNDDLMYAIEIAVSAGAAPQTWTGSIGTSTPEGVSGTFIPGEVTWSGSIGTSTPEGVSGDFVPGGAPQTWTGSTGEILSVGISGSFSGSGTATWIDGSIGSIAIVGVSGDFSEPGAEPGAILTNLTDFSPMLAMGEAVWGLCGNAGRWRDDPPGGSALQRAQKDYDSYLAARSSQGFTYVYTQAIGTTNEGCLNNDGRAYDGTMPFTSWADYPGTCVLNEAYWERIDYLIDRAAYYGMYVFLNPTGYHAYAHDTAGTWINGKSSNAYRSYGVAVGARYADRDNIRWLVGDDQWGYDDADYIAFRQGLRDSGANQPMTIEMYGSGTGSTSRSAITSGTPTPFANSSPAFVQYCEFNMVYTYDIPYFGVEQACAENEIFTDLPDIPVWYGDGQEYTYTDVRDRLCRNRCWWALSSGAVGYAPGVDAGVWQWQSGGLANLTHETDAAAYFVHVLKNIVDAVHALDNWQYLKPDISSLFPGGLLVTAGRGTKGTPTADVEYLDSTNAYVTVSRTDDGSLALIYFSHHTEITIDESKMVAGYIAEWIDPLNGTVYAGVTGTTYNSLTALKGGVQREHNSSPTETEPNSQDDWVLVLRAPSGGSPQTWDGSIGTISSEGVSGSFTPGAVTWAGSIGTSTPEGVSGSFVPGAVTWAGSIGTITAEGVSGSFIAGGQTWTGSIGTITAEGVSGSFSGSGTATWTGSTADLILQGVSGSFVPSGTGVWSGSIASVAISGVSGDFIAGGAPQTWTGSIATLSATGVSGSFVPGAISWSGSIGTISPVGVSASFVAGLATWSGSIGTINATGISGDFSGGFAPQTWTGSIGTITATGVSGSFIPGAATWTGSIATLNLDPISGVFGSGFVWTGSEGIINFAGVSGPFIPGGITWVGTLTATIDIVGISGVMIAGAVTWIGSIATISSVGISGLWSAQGIGGNVYVFNGVDWDIKPMKVFNGSTWQAKPIKRWTGTEWVLS